MVPASIRYKNPGAMWGNALAIKWGADPHPVTLNDGKHQNNNIAVFPTYVQGICAQMDLWRTSKNYRNKRFADAIAIWCGHNSVEQYIALVEKWAPGMTRDTVMDDAFWRGPLAIPFLKAQARHEAGQVYPAPDADWVEAQRRVLSGVPLPKTVKKAAGAIVVATAPVVVAASQGHSSLVPAFLVGVAVAVGLAVWYFLSHRNASANSIGVAKPDEQIQEHVGSVPDTVPVLRDQPGAEPSPIHVEGPGPFGLPEPLPAVHGDERPDGVPVRDPTP